jgi:hypothetical protein
MAASRRGGPKGLPGVLAAHSGSALPWPGQVPIIRPPWGLPQVRKIGRGSLVGSGDWATLGANNASPGHVKAARFRVSVTVVISMRPQHVKRCESLSFVQWSMVARTMNKLPGHKRPRRRLLTWNAAPANESSYGKWRIDGSSVSAPRGSIDPNSSSQWALLALVDGTSEPELPQLIRFKSPGSIPPSFVTLAAIRALGACFGACSRRTQ